MEQKDVKIIVDDWKSRRNQQGEDEPVDNLLDCIITIGSSDVESYWYTVTITDLVKYDGIYLENTLIPYLKNKLLLNPGEISFNEWLKSQRNPDFIKNKCFTAYYLLSLCYKRHKNNIALINLYETYNDYFKSDNYPLHWEIESRYYRRKNAGSFYREALSADLQALRILEDHNIVNEGVQTSFCVTILKILESIDNGLGIYNEADVKKDYVDSAWIYVENILKKHPYYAKYQGIAGLLLLYGQQNNNGRIALDELTIDDAIKVIKKARDYFYTAIRLEDTTIEDYLTRISDYEKYLSKCDFIALKLQVKHKQDVIFKEQETLFSEKLDIQKKIFESLIDEKMDAIRSRSFELNVIFTGVLALIVGSLSILVTFTFKAAALLIAELGLCLIFIYAMLKIIFRLEALFHVAQSTDIPDRKAERKGWKNLGMQEHSSVYYLILLCMIVICVGSIFSWIYTLGGAL